MNTDGSDLQNLSNHQAADNHPSWSPGGSSLMFVSTREAGAQAWLVSPNSQTPLHGVINEAGDEGGDFIFVKR
jgi:Tol biopolymer transport system component